MDLNKPYLLGETAFHHMGDVDFLKKLVDEISDCGMNAIKFHLTLDLEEYFVRNHEAFETVEKWLLNEDQWNDVFHYAHNKGLELVTLCNDTKALDFVMNHPLNVKAIELHAVCLNDYFLLEKVSSFKGSVILGVGGSDIVEINDAITFLNNNSKSDIILMYGFQNYPTDYKDVNFGKMIKIKELFGLEMGYADHTDPSDKLNAYISSLAISYGINLIEKHVTIDRSDRIDVQAAVLKSSIIELKEMIAAAFALRGNGSLNLTPAEAKYGNYGTMKKTVVAKKDIQEGEELSNNNMALKRTNEGSYLGMMDLPKLIGLKAKSSIKKDELIDFSLVNYEFKLGDMSHFKK